MSENLLDRKEMSVQYPDMPPTQYRPSRRNWIKLWTHEWLTGTVRWQLNSEQRAMWADLLALAGDSRFPGIVTPGEDGGKFIGYPAAYFAGLFRCPEIRVAEAFELFEQQNRIKVGNGGEIHIVNWEKYQSEYQEKRQRKQYKKKSAQDSVNVQQKSARLESEVEVEVEGEVEEEKITPSPTKTVGTMGSPEFRKFWDQYPKRVDRLEALKCWVKGFCDGNLGEILAGLEKWKATEQWTDPDKIPYPSTWLNKRRWKETPETGKAATKHERNRQITRAAVARIRSEIENS